MAYQSLKKLKRLDLLEMLIAQVEENERLLEKIDQLNFQLERAKGDKGTRLTPPDQPRGPYREMPPARIPNRPPVRREGPIRTTASSQDFLQRSNRPQERPWSQAPRLDKMEPLMAPHSQMPENWDPEGREG